MAGGVVQATASRRFGWYYGWNIVGLAVLLQMMAVGVTINCFSLFLLDWRHDFHAPVSTFQLAMIVFAIFCGPFTAFTGWAVDRYPIRWVVAAGLLIVAAMQVALAFSNSAWLVVALYAPIGVGVSLSSTIPAQALVSRWFVKRRGLALGISAFGNASAGVIFPPIIGVLMHAYGWRVTWWLFAGFIAAVVVPLLLMAVRDRPDPNDASGYLAGGIHQDPANAARLSYAQIVARPNVWIIGLPFIFLFSTYMGVMQNLAPLVRSHGLDARTAVLLLSAYGAADLVAKLLCGAATDRFGNRIPMVALCLIGAVSAAGLALAASSGLLIASLLGVALVGGVWTLLASAAVVEFGQQNFGRAFGLIGAFAPIGTLAPWVLARTQEWTGSYAPGLLGVAVLMFASAGLSMRLREKPPHPQGERGAA